MARDVVLVPTVEGHAKLRRDRESEMTTRKIVKIDEEKCNGCGECVPSCAEGAIQIIDGKAKLVSDVYCDGLGACLGKCPMDAITIEEREAVAFDEEKAKAHVESINADMKTHGCPSAKAMSATQGQQAGTFKSPCGCPSSAPRQMKPQADGQGGDANLDGASCSPVPSQLANWPVQLRLAPPNAPFFHDADLLLAADCTAFAFSDFHRKLLAGKVSLIACPKLDDPEGYVEKLSEIFKQVRSVTVVRMEVPCCAGIVRMAEMAAKMSGKQIEIKSMTVTISGGLIA